MNTTSTCFKVAGIDVSVVFKDVKHMHIGVYPPHGHVRVAAPQRLSEATVKVAVSKRLPWIRRQRGQLAGARRQTPRLVATGESHYVGGVRYRLSVSERPGRAEVTFKGRSLVMHAPAGTSTEQRLAVFDAWRRQRLRGQLNELVTKWTPKVGRSPSSLVVRTMKTKWGSCNPDTGRLSFNSELAAKHPEEVEYVVVHELVHLRVRGHGPDFTALMDKLLPNWRVRRDRLNAAPLAAQAFAHGS